AAPFASRARAQPPPGPLPDRFGARTGAMTILVLQAPLLALAGQLAGPRLMAVAIGMLLLVFAEIPITDWLIGRYVAGRWQSRVLGISYLGSLGVSAVAVPGISFLYERTGGFAVMFGLLALCAVAALAAALWLPARVSPRSSASPASAISG